jgi:hypothetical protein
MSETTRDVELEALARTLRKHIVQRHVTMPFEDDPKFGKVVSGSDWKAWDEATDATTVEYLAALRRVQPLPDTCPHCREGVNSEDKGGTERCFHCDRCDYIGCMWTNAEKLDMLKRVQPEPSAEGPTEAQVKALVHDAYTNGLALPETVGPRATRMADAYCRDVLAPPAADAEPEKEQP